MNKPADNQEKNEKIRILPCLRFPEFKKAEGWEVKPLGNISLFFKGKGLPKSEILLDGKNLCVHYGQLFTDYSEVIYSVKSRTNLDLDCFFSVENDVLMPTSDVTPKGLAKACCIKVDGVILGGDILIIRSNKTAVNGEFLSRSIRNYESQVLQLVSGTTVFHLYASAMQKMLLVFPHIREQQKIADCLSSLDDLIELEAKKLECLKEHKKGLMLKLFPAEGETVPRFRFREFEDMGNWEIKKLIDITDKKIKRSFIGGPFGSNLKSSDYVVDGVRIIQLQNIGDAEFLDTYKIFTSEAKADELLSNNIYPGEIILSKMGDPVGRACIIPDIHERYVMCSDGIRLVIDEEKNSKYFIYSLINFTQFRSLIEKTATGSTRKRIGLDELKNLMMLVPNKKEQQKIANCLSSLDDLITAQTQKIETLKTHKKGLMQQLFPVMN